VIFDGETGLADLSVTVPVPDITFLGQLSQPYTAALPKEEVERNRRSPVKVTLYDAGSTTSTRSPFALAQKRHLRSSLPRLRGEGTAHHRHRPSRSILRGRKAAGASTLNAHTRWAAALFHDTWWVSPGSMAVM
jgi:hypothetical protein